MKKVDTKAYYDQDLNYWLRPEGDFITLGVSDFAQAFFGKINQISDLPEPNQTLKRYTIFAIIESDKSTTELLMPIDAELVAINPALQNHPHWINEDCYGKGWILKISAPSFQKNDFLNAENYLKELHPFFNKSS